MVQELSLELTAERWHVAPLKVPPLPPSLQDTEPVGGDRWLAVSVTVAAKVIVLPMATEAGSGDTVVMVASNRMLVTVSADVPELAPCEGSPE
jgi:hypothetical protein